MSIEQEENVQETVRPFPWNLYQTLGLSLASIAIFVSVHTLLIRINAGPDPDPEFLVSLSREPFMICFSSMASSLMAIYYTIFLTRLKPQLTLSEYLSFKRVGIGRVLLWILGFMFATIILGFGMQYTGYRTPRVLVSLFSYDNVPLLIATVAVAGPVYEELLFRGFMLNGVTATAGPVLGVVISSSLFAVAHMQYNIYGVLFVFFIGLMLGYAKIKTGSIYIPIAMHSTLNLLMIVYYKALVQSAQV